MKLQTDPLESCLDDCSLKPDPEQGSPRQTFPQFPAHTECEKDMSCFQTLLAGEIGHVAISNAVCHDVNYKFLFKDAPDGFLTFSHCLSFHIQVSDVLLVGFCLW